MHFHLKSKHCSCSCLISCFIKELFDRLRPEAVTKHSACSLFLMLLQMINFACVSGSEAFVGRRTAAVFSLMSAFLASKSSLAKQVFRLKSKFPSSSYCLSHSCIYLAIQNQSLCPQYSSFFRNFSFLPSASKSLRCYFSPSVTCKNNLD